MTAPDITPHERLVPPLGGFNVTALGLEVRRMLRNRRTLMFIVVFPSLFFFLFGLSTRGPRAPGPEIVAFIMINMAVYGAMVGTTAGGAAVAVERSLGWSRQLRLTPLRPAAYVVMKVLTAMVLGFVAVATVFIVGALNGVHVEPHVWVLHFWRHGCALWCSLRSACSWDSCCRRKTSCSLLGRSWLSWRCSAVFSYRFRPCLR